MLLLVDEIPVFVNGYIVHFEENGDIYAVNGSFDPKAREYKVIKKDLINKNEAIDIEEAEVVFEELEEKIT